MSDHDFESVSQGVPEPYMHGPYLDRSFERYDPTNMYAGGGVSIACIQ